MLNTSAENHYRRTAEAASHEMRRITANCTMAALLLVSAAARCFISASFSLVRCKTRSRLFGFGLLRSGLPQAWRDPRLAWMASLLAPPRQSGGPHRFQGAPVHICKQNTMRTRTQQSLHRKHRCRSIMTDPNTSRRMRIFNSLSGSQPPLPVCFPAFFRTGGIISFAAENVCNRHPGGKPKSFLHPCLWQGSTARRALLLCCSLEHHLCTNNGSNTKKANKCTYPAK